MLPKSGLYFRWCATMFAPLVTRTIGVLTHWIAGAKRRGFVFTLSVVTAVSYCGTADASILMSVPQYGEFVIDDGCDAKRRPTVELLGSSGTGDSPNPFQVKEFLADSLQMTLSQTLPEGPLSSGGNSGNSGPQLVPYMQNCTLACDLILVRNYVCMTFLAIPIPPVTQLLEPPRNSYPASLTNGL
jgi:hypothetical protein